MGIIPDGKRRMDEDEETVIPDIIKLFVADAAAYGGGRCH
jgi:hypothetical protein